jgi:hypothetical protein
MATATVYADAAAVADRNLDAFADLLDLRLP